MSLQELFSDLLREVRSKYDHASSEPESLNPVETIRGIERYAEEAKNRYDRGLFSEALELMNVVSYIMTESWEDLGVIYRLVGNIRRSLQKLVERKDE